MLLPEQLSRPFLSCASKSAAAVSERCSAATFFVAVTHGFEGSGAVGLAADWPRPDGSDGDGEEHREQAGCEGHVEVSRGLARGAAPLGKTAMWKPSLTNGPHAAPNT